VSEKVVDLSDRRAAGALPVDPEAGAEPVNDRARRADADKPRVLSVRELLEQSMLRAASRENTRGCTTGIWNLDDVTGGLRPGHVWVVGADTGFGKSSWLVMIADENIKLGKRVLIVSSEDDESIYGDRLMARRARVDAKRMRDRKLDIDDLRRVSAEAGKGEDVPVYLDARGRKAELVAKQAEALIRNERIDLVAFDYLQEFRSGQRHQDRRNEVSEVAALLRMVAKRCGIAGILFSQITISDPAKPPTKHSIRESRDVSNGAEAVILGFRPTTNITLGSEQLDKGARYLFVDKVKDGPAQRYVQMDWDERCACFNAIRDPEQERIDATYDHQADDFEDVDPRYP
jgi:replicative DNA helicase